MTRCGLKLLRVGPTAVLLLELAWSGCRRQTSSSGERIAPNPEAPALYGPVTGQPSKEIARVRPLGAAYSERLSAPFYVMQTELSPAILVHSSTRHLGLFTGTTNYGLAAPTFIAWATMNGPRAFQRGEVLDVGRMEECWLLVWWAGAPGWTHWDSPWVIFLQHKPESLKWDDDGMHLEFGQQAGDVVLMPLYGYEKPPQRGPDFLAAHGLAGPNIKTWEWAKALTREPLTRIRYWAAAMREVPIYCEDSFRVDRVKDSVTIRSRFQWRSIDDDWQTRHLKPAPVSPPLAQAAKEGFPVEFSKPWFDLGLFTAYGPYLAIEGVEEVDATFPVLQYINETEAFDPPDTTAHAAIQLALDKLRRVAAQKFKSQDFDDDYGVRANFCWAIQAATWYAKALPYYEAPTRANALASLRKYFREEVLQTNRFALREYPQGAGRDYLIVQGTGAASWKSPGEAGRFSASLLETLWAYAHFTGDWALIRERWPLVKKLFTVPAEISWAGFGRHGIAELGDEATPCAAFARLAYCAGDLDSYHYGCYLFARELVHLFLKQGGADYFRKHQPWHSLEFMDEEVFLTKLQSDSTGWQIDGPRYPAKASERQFDRRWVRFKDVDVARFYREFLLEDARRELNWLQTRWPRERRWHNDPHELPSLVQLRSLLLNESPAELAAVASPDQFTGPPSGEIASALAVLRVSHPTRYERLIPPAEPSPLVAGVERDIGAPSTSLVTALQYAVVDPNTYPAINLWPELTWPAWASPTGARWSFGRVRPVRQGPPGKIETIPLNWNTRVVTFALP